MDNKSGSVKALVAFGILVALVGLVSAAGVSAPHWPGNPKIVYPGERGEVSMTIQNMVGDEDLTYAVSMIQNDGEIAKVDDGVYEVPFGSKDTEVILDYRIPQEAALGTTYTVRISFDTITSGESTGAKIGTGLEITIPFEVQDVEPLQSPVDMSFVYMIIVVVVAVLALVIVIVLVVRRRSAGAQQMPQSVLR